ncbi:hypothetical protein V8G54_004441 [Vigna mungo]|uniref:Uncharacterized protein n=1 Tax=Vigna mungo TaxID=3915 RepID=A0AAQ3PGD7_VIGMU
MVRASSQMVPPPANLLAIPSPRFFPPLPSNEIHGKLDLKLKTGCICAVSGSSKGSTRLDGFRRQRSYSNCKVWQRKKGMEGSARYWFKAWKAKAKNRSWEGLKGAMVCGTTVEGVAANKQSGTREEYAPASTVRELQEPIRNKELIAAMPIARDGEELNGGAKTGGGGMGRNLTNWSRLNRAASRVEPSRQTQNRIRPTENSGSVRKEVTQASGLAKSNFDNRGRNSGNLHHSQFAKCRKEDSCFRSYCPERSLRMMTMAEDEEEDGTEAETELAQMQMELSAFSAWGLTQPKKMKLQVEIEGKRALILMDSVASHKFGLLFRPPPKPPNLKLQVSIEAIENHMPQVMVIDEIGTKHEAMAASTIVQRGIQLICKVANNEAGELESKTMELDDAAQNDEAGGLGGGRRVVVLINSGANHNFISEDLAEDLKLLVIETSPYPVSLGDGWKKMTQGRCNQIQLSLGEAMVVEDFYLFDLGGVDIILGIAWLAKLGGVVINWKEMTMGYNLAGKRVRVKGNPALSTVRGKHSRVFQGIKGLSREDNAWQSELTAAQEADQHSRVFQEIKGLPPFGEMEHLITLKEGVNVSKELIKSILSHLIQLRTLKRNLKNIINMGLSAKKEEDNRFQQIKKEVIYLIRMLPPTFESKQQRKGEASGDFQEFDPGGKTKNKYKKKVGHGCCIGEENAGPYIRKTMAQWSLGQPWDQTWNLQGKREDVTWEDRSTMADQCPKFNLEDKVVNGAEGNVRTWRVNENGFLTEEPNSGGEWCKEQWAEGEV